MTKTNFEHGTAVTPEFLNAINHPEFVEDPQFDGQFPVPPQIIQEAARAQGVENDLATALASETQRAQLAEQALAEQAVSIPLTTVFALIYTRNAQDQPVDDPLDQAAPGGHLKVVRSPSGAFIFDAYFPMIARSTIYSPTSPACIYVLESGFPAGWMDEFASRYPSKSSYVGGRAKMGTVGLAEICPDPPTRNLAHIRAAISVEGVAPNRTLRLELAGLSQPPAWLVWNDLVPTLQESTTEVSYLHFQWASIP